MRERESRLMAGPKDAQVVVRMPTPLLEAVKAHQRKLQDARPFERITLAVAVRDLLAIALGVTRAKEQPRKSH